MRLLRSFGLLLLALVGSWLAPYLARAQTRHVAIGCQGEYKICARIAAEVEAVGFATSIVDLADASGPGHTAVTTSAQQLAQRWGATGAIVAGTASMVTVWIPRTSGPALSREFQRVARTEEADSELAIRIAEALRESQIEVHDAPTATSVGSAPSALVPVMAIASVEAPPLSSVHVAPVASPGATVPSANEGPAPATPDDAPSARPVPPTSAPAPSPSSNASSTSGNAHLAEKQSARIRVSLGPSILTGTAEMSPLVSAMLGVHWALSSRVGLAFFGHLPLLASSTSRTEGRLEVRAAGLGAGVRFVVPTDTFVTPSIDAGLAMMWVQVSGTPSQNYAAETDAIVCASPYVSMGARVRLNETFGMRADLTAGFLFQNLAIRSAGNAVGNWGAPWALASVSWDFAL